MKILSSSIFCFFISLQLANAQAPKGTLYASWGYNKEWYTRSDIHIKQTNGNAYYFKDVVGHDKPGWNEKLLQKELTIPQYNARMGYFIKKGMAIEINFDHTKYQVLDQLLHLKGRYNNRQVDTFFQRNNDNLYYQLNNGANFLLINWVNDFPIQGLNNKNYSLSLVLKTGAGIVIPHVENKIMYEANVPHFQIGGVDLGVETALKATVREHFFIEFSQKAVVAQYWGLRISNGYARQLFGCYEVILSVGAQLNVHKKTRTIKI